MIGNSKNRELMERAYRVIPGGMYGHESVVLLPEGYPQFFARAEGARLWDVDGNEYVDYMCAYGPNLFGYKHPSVEAAARAQAELGDTMTGPSELFVRMAEDFVAMVDHADWAMFCKNGSDATSMAMMMARAHTGRRKILVAKGTYHGASVWSTPSPIGTLPEDRAHIIYFSYDDLDSLREAVKEAGDDVAAVFATPFRHEVFHDQSDPPAAYAKGVRQICDEIGALLVVDEIRTGFRLARDCSWAQFGVKPDLSAWGKVLANGYPLSAVLGAEKVRAAAQKIFVTGSFWFSAVPMAAGVETLRLIRETDYLERMVAIADRLRAGVAEQAAAYGFGIRQTGPSQMPLILFDDDPDMRYGYYWTAAALRRGVYLHPYHNMFVTPALTEADVQKTLSATDQAFGDLKRNHALIGPQANLALASRFGNRAVA